ncbi:MAG: hypothetical protein GY847_11345 [Proteobacteria bacterium]|nr:hypothetical protein [Pseudomonadota bacterium]
MNKTYRQPALIKVVAWCYIALTTPVFFVLFGSFWQGTLDDVAALIVIPLLFMPFYIGAWWTLWKFRGQFILTDEGIILSQLGRQTFLRYQDIHTIEERDSQLLPYLLLVTPETRLIILFKVEHFSDLYANLRQRISALRDAERVTFPLNLRLGPVYLRQVGVIFSIYAIFTGILSLWGTFGQTHLTIWNGLFIWTLFLVVAVGALLMNEWKTPFAVTFENEAIKARYLLGKARIWNTRDVTRIERERQVRHLRYGSRMIVYPLVLTFASGEKLQIEEGRIWSFGYAPDRLLAILTRQLMNNSIQYHHQKDNP